MVIGKFYYYYKISILMWIQLFVHKADPFQTGLNRKGKLWLVLLNTEAGRALWHIRLSHHPQHQHSVLELWSESGWVLFLSQLPANMPGKVSHSCTRGNPKQTNKQKTLASACLNPNSSGPLGSELEDGRSCLCLFLFVSLCLKNTQNNFLKEISSGKLGSGT